MKPQTQLTESSYLAFAFDRLVTKRITKYYYLELLILFIGAGLWDKHPTIGSLIIGFAIGAFVVTAAIAGLVEKRRLICKGLRTTSGQIEVNIDGVSLVFPPESDAVKWLSHEKSAFYFLPPILFCDVKDAPPMPAASPQHTPPPLPPAS